MDGFRRTTMWEKRNSCFVKVGLKLKLKGEAASTTSGGAGRPAPRHQRRQCRQRREPPGFRPVRIRKRFFRKPGVRESGKADNGVHLQMW
jgi:hypothetical protein